MPNECPPDLPADLSQHLRSFGRGWAGSAQRPRPTRTSKELWEVFLHAWLGDQKLPLIVRRSGSRGSIVTHESGRQLVLADNSPAQWAFALALRGEVPDPTNIKSLLEEGLIPVALALRSIEQATAVYQGILYSEVNLNIRGYKLCHVEPVRMGGRGGLATRDMDEIRSHFKRFLSPANMFVIPKAWGGLGEVEEVIRAIQEADV